MLRALLPEWEVVHFGVPPKDVFTYHAEGIHRAGSRSIVDRLHWSEYAYGKTYRNKCGYTRSKWRAMERTLYRLGCSVILMGDSVEKIQSRWGDEPFPKEKVRQLVEHFEDLRKGRSDPKSFLPCVRLVLSDLKVVDVQGLADLERRKFEKP